jgi:hypothetical protein
MDPFKIDFNRRRLHLGQDWTSRTTGSSISNGRAVFAAEIPAV